MMRAAIAERAERRRWKAWAILEPDEALYRISTQGPDESEALQKLIRLGWFAIPVEVVER